MVANDDAFLQFRSYPSQRPIWIDPWRVSAVFDLIVAEQPKIQGAPPVARLAGACALVDGATLNLAEDADIVWKAVEHRRREVRIGASSSLVAN